MSFSSTPAPYGITPSSGLIQPMSISANASLAVLPRLSPLGLLRPGRERSLTRRFMEQLSIKATSSAQVVRSLSGGNQQKVVLGKSLSAEPRILILDEPTHGVDVGTKADVHRTVSHLAAQGLTILLISSELLEVLGIHAEAPAATVDRLQHRVSESPNLSAGCR